MSLVDAPESQGIESATYVIPAENQHDVEMVANQGGKVVRFHFNGSLGHYLPSQSTLQFSIVCNGRGAPCPRSGGFNSLFDSVRISDGSNSQVLSEVLNYSGYCAQIWHYTQSETNCNQRSMFAGLQQGRDVQNCTYWTQAQPWFENVAQNGANKAREVQIAAPLETYLYNTEDYVALGPLNGLRTELTCCDPVKSLSYLTGSLGDGIENGLKFIGSMMDQVAAPVLCNTLPGGGLYAGPATAEANPFQITTPGTNYVDTGADEYRTFAAVPSGAVGSIRITTVNAGAPTAFHIYGVGAAANLATLQPGDVVTVQVATNAGAAMVFRINDGTVAAPHNIVALPVGQLRKLGNGAVAYPIPLCAPTTAEVGGALAQPAGFYGDGSVKRPFRGVSVYNPAYGSGFPDSAQPFEVGDAVYCAQNNGTDEVLLGCLVEITKGAALPVVAENHCVLWVCPNVANSVSPPGANNPVIPGAALTGIPNRYYQGASSVYFKSADRINGVGWGNHIPDADYANQKANGAEKIGVTLKDMAYHMKRVFLPPQEVQAEIEAARSGKGFTFDIDNVFCCMNNIPASIIGPISLPLITPSLTRARAALCTFLDSAAQGDPGKDSNQGFCDRAQEYHFLCGSKKQPTRDVTLKKLNLNDPMPEVQSSMETIKTIQSFGHQPTNIVGALESFCLGRQFARLGQYYSLQKAGSLSLVLRYAPTPVLNKLVLSFISHTRRIVVNNMGVSVSD